MLVISCKKDNQTIIKGNIPNLPDGVIYLIQDYDDNKIDSAETKNGIFEIKHIFNKNSEPVFLGLTHMDTKGVKRLFSFITNAKYKGVGGWGTSLFLSDPTVVINGKIKENVIPALNLPSNIKLVNSPPIVAGQQTEAYYNVDGDLFEHINAKTFTVLKQKISKYPYSYSLLYSITENKNTFSAQQVQEFLKLFQGEITKSQTYKKLNIYNQKRFNESKISLPLLDSEKGEKSLILDKKYKKHLVIFWASWCGPCRAEIPLLKKIYAEEKNNIEFISISTDTDKKSWTKALEDEKMDWKQLIVQEKNSAYESLQIHFKMNQAIPYTVVVDNNLKILGSSVGLSTADELKKLIDKN